MQKLTFHFISFKAFEIRLFSKNICKCRLSIRLYNPGSLTLINTVCKCTYGCLFIYHILFSQFVAFKFIMYQPYFLLLTPPRDITFSKKKKKGGGGGGAAPVIIMVLK